MDFSDDQIVRYSRQILLKEIGGTGQERLLFSSVLIIGAGGLGSAVLIYLAGSGIGRIGIIEYDRVDPGNLHRQILYNTDDIGRLKLEVASEKLLKINPDIKMKLYNLRLEEKNSEKIFTEYDLIIDCTDNFESRFLINRIAVKLNKPLLSGAVVRFNGNVMLIIPHKTFCYNCIFEKPDEDFMAVNCSNSGVLGSVVGTVATIMATEAIKFLLGLPSIEKHLLIYDGLKSEIRRIAINKNPSCNICS